MNPKLPGYAYVFGQFDFNATPLAPPGTKVLVHSKPKKWATWDFNGIEGWYIGPSLQHYRCMKCFMPTTRAEVNADTITFFPKTIKFPKVDINDFLRQAATDIITLLTNPPPPLIPSLSAGDDSYNAILQLATILNRNEIPDKTFDSLTEQTFAAAAANIQNIPKFVPPTPLKPPPPDPVNTLAVL